MMEQYYREVAGVIRSGDRLVQTMRPAPFRKPEGLKPVRGGRWSIRKLRHTGYWRAWTSGTASRWNRKFYYQVDAMAWAQMVAYAYKVYPAHIANLHIQAVWNELKRDPGVRASELRIAHH